MKFYKSSVRLEGKCATCAKEPNEKRKKRSRKNTMKNKMSMKRQEMLKQWIAQQLKMLWEM